MDKIQIPKEPFKKSHKPVNEMVGKGDVFEIERKSFTEKIRAKIHSAIKSKGDQNGNQT